MYDETTLTMTPSWLRATARLAGVLLAAAGLLLLGLGLGEYVGHLDQAPGAARVGLVPAASGLVALTLGLLLAGRIASPPAPPTALGAALGAAAAAAAAPTDAPAAAPTDWQVVAVPIGHRDAQRLIAQVQEEYTRRYGGPDESPIDEAEFVGPRGGFHLGYCDGVPVATGGWRLRDDVTALEGRTAGEIKRMYVVPDVQRRGFGRRMLALLEQEIRTAGGDVVILETGIRQPEAIGLYTASGYVPIDGYGHYRDSPESRCFGKRLLPQVPAPRPAEDQQSVAEDQQSAAGDQQSAAGDPQYS
ncbi:GNAT family N-acetyltransferase [Nocardioides limicola]|uniref:GNAT family N-acetyltransferase n=1 Tax=Nocardioides limicola TaxID=2803368 RepID=UPI001EF1586E|nr:GNAT family N-acetyltransferase [Nocardioides sp. DJM-14]